MKRYDGRRVDRHRKLLLVVPQRVAAATQRHCGLDVDRCAGLDFLEQRLDIECKLFARREYQRVAVRDDVQCIVRSSLNQQLASTAVELQAKRFAKALRRLARPL